jgi:hypothetical protein
LAGAAEALSSDYVHHAGVYVASEKLLAVNRSPAEDQAAVLGDERVAELFKGLNFTRVDDRAGSLIGLIQEIWRPFLILMLIAMLVEAGLCLPRRQPPRLEEAGFPRTHRNREERPMKAADLSRAKA